MVIIYTSSRRAVLRRFAALLIAPQRFVFYITTCRCATPLREPHCSAIHRNDLLCTTQRTPLLTALLCIVSPRSASRRSAPLLPAELLKATQRFVCYVAPCRSSALCSVTRHNSTPLLAIQLNDLFVTSCRRAPLRYATLRNSAQRFVCYNATNGTALLASSPRITPLFIAPIRNSTQRFVCYVASQRIAPYRKVAQLITTLLNDLFVTTQPNATRLASTRRGSLHFSSTQRFVCYNDDSPRRNSTLVDAPHLYATPRISTQRTETLTRKTNVQTFETNFGNV